MWTPIDPQSLTMCPDVLSTYWPYSHVNYMSIIDSTFTENAAMSSASSGGGLYLASGGVIVIRNTSFTNNSAALFGGAINFANGGTCALQLVSGTTISGNRAAYGSAQVYMGCTADVLVEDVTAIMTTSGSQASEELSPARAVGEQQGSGIVRCQFVPVCARCVSSAISAPGGECNVCWWYGSHLPHRLQFQR